MMVIGGMCLANGILPPTSVKTGHFSAEELTVAEAELRAASLDEDQIMELVEGEETDIARLVKYKNLKQAHKCLTYCFEHGGL
jgi:hypothetical protein